MKITRTKIVVAGVLIGVLFSIVYGAQTAMDLFKTMPAYYSKELCSCMFVTGRAEGVCMEAIRQDIDPWTISIDMEHKKVYTSGFGRFMISEYSGEHYGCKTYPE